jgi:hypothetical protein
LRVIRFLNRHDWLAIPVALAVIGFLAVIVVPRVIRGWSRLPPGQQNCFGDPTDPCNFFGVGVVNESAHPVVVALCDMPCRRPPAFGVDQGHSVSLMAGAHIAADRYGSLSGSVGGTYYLELFGGDDHVSSCLKLVLADSLTIDVVVSPTGSLGPPARRRWLTSSNCQPRQTGAPA